MATGIKISELPDGGLPQSTDSLPAGRNESTVRIRVSELNNAKIVAQVPNTTFSDLVSSNIGTGDFFRIRAGASTGTGEVEIFTGNNGNEPIYVRQYNAGSSLRTLTLLDGSGFTIIPSRLNVGSTSAPTRALTIAGDASITGNTTAPLLDVIQNGSGFGLRTKSIAINTTTHSPNGSYSLTVIGGVSASGNFFSDTTASQNSHLVNKKLLDETINNTLNSLIYVSAGDFTQNVDGEKTFNKITRFNNGATFSKPIIVSTNTGSTTPTHIAVLSASGGNTSQLYARTTSDIRSLIAAEPSFSVLPVSKGGTGVSSLTADCVLVGAGAAINGLSRSGIDTRPAFRASRYSDTVPGGSASVEIIHNLNLGDPIVQVYQQSGNRELVYPTVRIVDNNTVRLIFSTTPAANEYRIVIV